MLGVPPVVAESTREYRLIFATPLPGLHVQHDEITAESGGQFGNTFFELMLEL